jgi:hypothetical protein
VPLDEAMLTRAIAVQQPALLLFENGDPTLPIIAGLIQPAPGAELLASLLEPRRPADAATPATTPSPAPTVAPPLEGRVDGKRVVLEGRDEVTLKCGEALITLRRDGKVILRGVYIETTATGVNRIRGGSVKIN